MSLRGVILDMDGVLCHSEGFLAEAAAAMFANRHGIDVDPSEFRPFIGTGDTSYLQSVAEQRGITLNLPDDKQALYDEYFRIAHGRLQPAPGAIDMIQACLARGIRIAVATCADHRKLEGNLREIGLPPDKFHAVVTAEDVTKNKPDPEIYTLAAHQLDLSPTDCLVIEDSPAGINAAKTAGAHCLGITSSFDAATLRDHGADWTARDLGHLPEAAVCW